jgi:hypothetical protein
VRPRSLARVLGVPVAAVGIVAGAAVAAPAAHAQTVNIDTSGTVAITVPFSYVLQLAKAGIVEFPVPLSELSVDTSNETATVTFTVTGGDADVNVTFGQVDLSGSIDVVNRHRHHHRHLLRLGGLELDVANGQVDATPPGSSTPVVLLDLGGSVVSSSTPSSTNPLASSDVYDASELTVDPAGAAYLDSALHTSAFQAGQDVGSIAASWDVVYPS